MQAAGLGIFVQQGAAAVHGWASPPPGALYYRDTWKRVFAGWVRVGVKGLLSELKGRGWNTFTSSGSHLLGQSCWRTRMATGPQWPNGCFSNFQAWKHIGITWGVLKNTPMPGGQP